MLHIPEVLGHGQARQTHPHTGSGGLVHLAEYHGGFADNAGLGHFVVQVIALAGTFTNAGEYGIAVVGGGNVVNQLLDQNGFAHAGAAEQADFAALGVGADQVDDLDAGFQNFGSGLLLLIGGGGTVDGPLVVALNRLLVVDGLTQQVKHTAKAGIAHGNPDGGTGIGGLGAPGQAVGGAHGDAAHHIVTDVLGDLGHDDLVAARHFDGV